MHPAAPSHARLRPGVLVDVTLRLPAPPPCLCSSAAPHPPAPPHTAHPHSPCPPATRPVHACSTAPAHSPEAMAPAPACSTAHVRTPAARPPPTPAARPHPTPAARHPPRLQPPCAIGHPSTSAIAQFARGRGALLHPSPPQLAGHAEAATFLHPPPPAGSPRASQGCCARLRRPPAQDPGRGGGQPAPPCASHQGRQGPRTNGPERRLALDYRL
jgi:hypothetical protein